MHFVVYDGWNAVLHDEHMNGLELVDYNGEDSVNVGNHRVLVGVNVLKVGWKRSQHVLDFGEAHGLQQELGISREKEETATGSSSFSRILNLLDVLRWFNRLVKFFITYIVRQSDPFERLLCILFDKHVPFDVDRSSFILILHKILIHIFE